MVKTVYLTLALAAASPVANSKEVFDINKYIGVREVSSEQLETMGCRELYLAATSFERDTRQYRSTLINENTDILVSSAGTVFKPAIYAYTITIPWHFKEDYRIVHTNISLDEIRRRMSALQCFRK